MNLLDTLRRWFERLGRLFAGSKQREEPRREPAQAPAEPEVPSPPSSEARAEFAAQIDGFIGLYEPLHSASVSSPDAEHARRVLSQWERRITNSESDLLERMWSDASGGVHGLAAGGGVEHHDDPVTLGRRWLEVLDAWGVKRDDREPGQVFVLSEDDLLFYRVSGTEDVGAKVRVELPSWAFDGGVVEWGIAHALAEDGHSSVQA